MSADHKHKNTRNAGQPRLSKGEVKGRIVPVRLSSEDLKRITAAASASNQTVSKWIRTTLNAAVQD